MYNHPKLTTEIDHFGKICVYKRIKYAIIFMQIYN
jgi:hypothetical protein